MKPTTEIRKPYNGTTKSLAIALDVGTTFSGVSYAILEPGDIPKIHGVTRFPGQEHVAGNSKIPTILYYNQSGSMVAAGAEADNSSMEAQAEEEGWTKAELFKLRLRPRAMKLEMNGMRLGPLPRGKSAVDLFGDFLGYLFRCTRVFIVDTHANGPALWKSVEKDIQFVLSHPNGWEGSQQSKMRRAAIHAGLIPDTPEGKARVRFVTEGEASLHACVLNGLAADVLSNPSGHGFLVADAGGGTLDISSYAIRGTSPLVMEEVAPPDCIFAGSVFVSRRARALFEEKLKSSKYGTPDSLDHITKRFDETTKRLFRDRADMQYVPFGSPFDKDATAGIRGGQLRLTGNEVADLFEPSIRAAVTSIKSQIASSKGVVKSVWLVGGFAASPWLFAQLQTRLSHLKVTVSRPDSQTSKAVADGAIGFYCDHHVSARMSKYMYGVEFLREYNATDEEHIARQHRLFELPSGPKLLPDAFDCILGRSIKVKESTTFSRKYCTELTSLSTLSVFEVEVWCYRGAEDTPKWILRNKEDFSTLCFVKADLSPLSGSAQPKSGRGGKTYWTIVFSIEIHFGLTEFKARIKWNDNGKVKYGPASIVYNESGIKEEEEEPEGSVDDQSSRSAYHSRTPSMAPSAIGTPRTRSPESQTYLDVREGVSKSPAPPPATLAPPERKKTSTSRSISSKGKIPASHHNGPPRSPSQPPADAFPPATSTSTPYSAPRSAPAPVDLTSETEPTPTKHASPRTTPTHSRTSSIHKPAVTPSNVVFPSEPTPAASPRAQSRRLSASSKSISESVVVPELSESRRESISSRNSYAEPALSVVESRKSSFSRTGSGTPVSTTVRPPSPPVVPFTPEPPPTITVTEAPKNKSRSASTASSTAPSIVKKGKSKATTASNSAAPTNATTTPLTRSTRSSIISRNNSGQLAETLTGVWGALKSVAPSVTTSPVAWKGGKPLDATVEELRKELAASAPPIAGNSEKPLETIVEPPTTVAPPARTRTGSYASKNADPAPLEQKLEARVEEPQEQQPQTTDAEQPPPLVEDQPAPVGSRDLSVERRPQSLIPGGFDEFDILGEPAAPEPEPVHEPEPEPKPEPEEPKPEPEPELKPNPEPEPELEPKPELEPEPKPEPEAPAPAPAPPAPPTPVPASPAITIGRKGKKGKGSRDVSSVPTPIELTGITPWGSQDGAESKDKVIDTTSSNKKKKKAGGSKEISAVSTPIEPNASASPWVSLEKSTSNEGNNNAPPASTTEQPLDEPAPAADNKKGDTPKDVSSVPTPIKTTAPASPIDRTKSNDNSTSTPVLPATLESPRDVSASAKEKGDVSKVVSSVSTPIDVSHPAPWNVRKTGSNGGNESSATPVLSPIVEPQPKSVDQLYDQLNDSLAAQREDGLGDSWSDPIQKEQKSVEKSKESSGGGWGSWGTSLFGSAAKELLGGSKSASPVGVEQPRDSKIIPKIEEPKAQPGEVSIPTSRPSGWGVKPTTAGLPSISFGAQKSATTWGAASKATPTQTTVIPPWGAATGKSSFGSTSFGASAKPAGSVWGANSGAAAGWGTSASFGSVNKDISLGNLGTNKNLHLDTTNTESRVQESSLETPIGELPQSAVEDIKQVPEPRRVEVAKPKELVVTETKEEEEATEKGLDELNSWETVKKSEKGSKVATPVEHAEDKAADGIEEERKNQDEEAESVTGETKAQEGDALGEREGPKKQDEETTNLAGETKTEEEMAWDEWETPKKKKGKKGKASKGATPTAATPNQTSPRVEPGPLPTHPPDSVAPGGLGTEGGDVEAVVKAAEDAAVEEGTAVEGATGEGATGEGATGDGATGDGATGDGAIGEGAVTGGEKEEEDKNTVRGNNAPKRQKGANKKGKGRK